jgi:hypothetical protein
MTQRGGAGPDRPRHRKRETEGQEHSRRPERVYRVLLYLTLIERIPLTD